MELLRVRLVRAVDEWSGGGGMDRVACLKTVLSDVLTLHALERGSI